VLAGAGVPAGTAVGALIGDLDNTMAGAAVIGGTDIITGVGAGIVVIGMAITMAIGQVITMATIMATTMVIGIIGGVVRLIQVL
jgi:hypothetical protein